MADDESLIKAIFSHIVLPPKLPGRHDAQSELIENDLTERMVKGVDFLIAQSHGTIKDTWLDLKLSLGFCQKINNGGSVSKKALIESFYHLCPGISIIVHATEQNAGLFIYQEKTDPFNVIVETFEASPVAETVLASPNALLCGYPGTAVSVNAQRFQDDDFQESLASFIENASTESVKGFAAQARKAGVNVAEYRDTVNPALITELLMTLLEGIGRRVHPPLLCKRVRDDVCWKNAELPWRRSPFWLILRVCVRRRLSFSLDPEVGRLLYKLLMCVVHAQLLQDCGSALRVEERSFLKTKLCRRMAKLAAERVSASGALLSIYNTIFPTIERECEMAVHKAAKGMDKDWAAFKRETQRKIPNLPLRASDCNSRLNLSNGLQYLEDALERHQRGFQGQRRGVVEPPMGNIQPLAIQRPRPLTDHIIWLAGQENKMKQITLAYTKSVPAQRCADLAGTIVKYMESGLEAYKCSVEQKSLMLLLIFELWVAMDKCAIEQFPLLTEYHPAFPPGLLDILQLVHWEDMMRLHRVQGYLRQRCEQCRFQSTTIFADPSPECFAVRYIDQDSSGIFENLKQQIENDAHVERGAKINEMIQGNDRYNHLTCEIDATSCSCNRDKNGRTTKRCPHCRLRSKRKQLRIEVHEYPLPMHTTQQKVVLFELAMPPPFAAYRDTTWGILTTFGITRENPLAKGDPPKMFLYAYRQLDQYRTSPRARFALASDTKSFHVAHYSRIRFPTTSDRVLVPFGLKLSYFDTIKGFWCKQLKASVTFRHHFGLDESVLTLLNIQDVTPFTAEASGPTSYEIIASRTKCPHGLTVHEFMAYQTLLFGRNTRWLSMLRELGSSNLNFGLEQTLHVYRHLSLQVGPTLGHDTISASHIIFQDDGFCRQLLAQIARHLHGISCNWREPYYMELLLTLTLRICNLAPVKYVQDACETLMQARQITTQWIRLLRKETHAAPDISDATGPRMYAMLAAILCKRTFLLAVENQQPLSGDELECFVLASIVLHDNLPADVSGLSPLARSMLIRDLKMTQQLEQLLRQSIQSSQRSLDSAIRTTWSGAVGLSKWSFLPTPWEGWVVSTVQPTDLTSPQTVHYHLLDGSLLVDNKPLGRLPQELQDSPIVHELFGDEYLRTFPSALPGMTCALSTPRGDHEIHFGLRTGKPIIQARVGQTLLEFVSRDVFGTGKRCDLPASLVEDCVHWLNFRTGELECRRRPNIWKLTRPGNWKLNVRSRRAHRRNVILVDPHSEVAGQITGIFRHFEDATRLTIFQPSRGRLTVELKRMDLTFRVNGRRLLESKELRCEIDPDQDAGTWYGLQSMIVVRDSRNILQRAIIVPIGELEYERRGPHVTTRIDNNGRYGKYHINDVLGRLDCASEPLLLFTKAQLHAYTSFVLPDPLTNRTGTEEALACLSSGATQPWAILQPHQLQPLLSMTQLAPRRTYYPEHLKKQQLVRWDSRLTVMIQHDAYRSAVDAILAKLSEMAIFADNAVELPEWEPEAPSLLRRRGLITRLRVDRLSSSTLESSAAHDLQYRARDILNRHTQTNNASEIIQLLVQRPSLVHTAEDLGLALQVPLVKGYKKSFSKYQYLFEDLLKLDVAKEWGPLVKFCRKCTSNKKYTLVFKLGTIAYNQNVNMDLLRTAASFSFLDELSSIKLPDHRDYEGFQKYQAPTLDNLINLISLSCPQCNPKSSENPSPKVKGKRAKARRKEHQEMCEKDTRDIAVAILEQWPSPGSSLEAPDTIVVDSGEAMYRVMPEWERLYRNWEFSQHITEVQSVLDRHRGQPVIQPEPHLPEEFSMFPTPARSPMAPSLVRDLIQKRGLDPAPQFSLAMAGRMIIESVALRKIPSSFTKSFGNHERLPKIPVIEELKEIIGEMTSSSSSVSRQYGMDLMSSLVAYENRQGVNSSNQLNIRAGGLDQKISVMRDYVKEQFDSIYNCLAMEEPGYKWLQRGGLWPCISNVTLLETLQSKAVKKFGKHMRNALVLYALSITRLQHLLRMQDAEKKGDIQRLDYERGDVGHSNWEPEDWTDWLLLEIDANILIRSEQINVALATISPASGANSVLQMNMGQGKTSVILPMVACALAEGNTLARLIVPRALLQQTAHVLQSRLGGLVGREIGYVPFQRKTPTDQSTIQVYRNIHKRIIRRFGVMLSLPENILSFKLSGLQALADGQLTSAKDLIDIQSWLDKISRDVIDESDFTLAVKTQLIYPSGPQLPVDGHPHRWKVAQVVLNMVENHLPDLQQQFPGSIDVVPRAGGGFPFIYFMRSDAEQALHQRLVDDLCRGPTSLLPIRNTDDQRAVRAFLLEAEVDSSVTDYLSQKLFTQTVTMKVLHLLRGLLVDGILILCLKRRWNVQYGLHPRRDPIAVPFHAKGVPSEQAEWGHPDVAILFTCLAFYYSGVTVPQLRSCLQIILRSDDPGSQYDRWTHQTAALPSSLQHWNTLNVDDDKQIYELWQHVRFTRVVINDFLNHSVFPLHSRQFLYRLEASGWDIPLFSVHCEQGYSSNSDSVKPITTGFSGTNDNRRMLPLTIRQEDLPELSHTNAEVLTYLLQPRNRSYIVAAEPDGRRLSELGFLQKLKSMGIRLLIDAGAHILELSNKDLMRQWLEIDHEAPAGIYFDANNQAMVLHRNLKDVPLLASPYADNSENCLVYLDEAHTRGTDLKFPASCQGALTLGLGQTKDHTIQAAMRLRQLGSSQSIVFVASPEVNQSILDHRRAHAWCKIDAHNVVSWILEQTCRGNEKLQSLYVAQGDNFCRRKEAAALNSKFLFEETDRKQYVKVLRQQEQHTLEDLYKPGDMGRSSTMETFGVERLQSFMDTLRELKENMKERSRASRLQSVFAEVEQQREVAREVEEERQVQHPSHFKALEFQGLHPRLRAFAETGAMVGFGWCEPMFFELGRTKIGKKHGIYASRQSRIFLSFEFTRTIKRGDNYWHDDFLRPVHWLLWSPSSQSGVVIIPEEAEALIPLMRNMSQPGTHLVMYSAPVTRHMSEFSSLQFFTFPNFHGTFPSWLRIELGLLAGRLYFEFDDYEEIVRYLQPRDGQFQNHNEAIAHDAIGFFEAWFAATRKTQDFEHTPMGYVCQGRPLGEDHPFFATDNDIQMVIESSSQLSLQPSITEDKEDESASTDGSESDIDVDVDVDVDVDADGDCIIID